MKVKCPRRRHHHKITMVPHPDNPDRLVGMCEGVPVIEMDVPPDRLEELTVRELKELPEWSQLSGWARPTRKKDIIAAIQKIRESNNRRS